MKYKNRIKTSLVVMTFSLILAACGGGGSDSASANTPVNNPPAPTPTNSAPVVNAGDDQVAEVSVYTNITIHLAGTASDSDGSIQSVKWENKTTDGADESIELLNSEQLDASFEFKNMNITEPQIYTLSLTVTDDDGATTNDEVEITINPNVPVDITLPDNIHGARLVSLSENKILITGGCKKLIAEKHETYTLTYGCYESSYKAFVLALTDNSLQQVGDANFARPYPLQLQSTTLLSDGRVMLYSQDNGKTRILKDGSTYINFNEYGKHYGEIYDPQTQQFTPISSMNMIRDFAMPAQLSDETLVYFAGTDHAAQPGETHTQTIEFYTPATDSWEFSSALYPERYDGIVTATLPGDKVLLVGGRNVGGGVTNKAYIYDHKPQSLEQIETFVPSIENQFIDSLGASVQILELGDGSICLIPPGYDWVARFDTNALVFNYDKAPCEQWRNIGNFVRDGMVFNNGKAKASAAHIEFKSGRVWITQQFVDLKHISAEYNDDGNYYEYTEPMTIRILR